MSKQLKFPITQFTTFTRISYLRNWKSIFNNFTNRFKNKLFLKKIQTQCCNYSTSVSFRISLTFLLGYELYLLLLQANDETFFFKIVHRNLNLLSKLNTVRNKPIKIISCPCQAKSSTFYNVSNENELRMSSFIFEFSGYFSF